MTDLPSEQSSPPWNNATKVILIVVVLILSGLLIWRFQTLISMIVIAALIAYLLTPLIRLLHKRAHIKQGYAVVIVYLALAALVVAAFSALGVAFFQQGVNLIEQAPTLIVSVTELVQEFVTQGDPLILGPITITPNLIPWNSISEQLLGLAEPALGQSATLVSRVATVTVRTVINLVFIFFVSLYLSSDLLRLDQYILRIAGQPGYREDAERLVSELRGVWSAYLRGQILLALTIFFMAWIGLALLGVQNSLALGLLSGLLEFVPTIGPVVGAVVAMIVAFFQPSNYLGLSPWLFALAVLALMVIIQQLENGILVPRIVGGALDLPPFLVIVGVFMGASLAGILGAVLAAPIIASIKVFGSYAWRKLFDLPPFEEGVSEALLEQEPEQDSEMETAVVADPHSPPTS